MLGKTLGLTPPSSPHPKKLPGALFVWAFLVLGRHWATYFHKEGPGGHKG